MSDLQQLIDRYLANDLEAGEKRAFEKRVAEEPELAETLALEKQARALVRLGGRRDLKAKLEALEQAEEKPIARRRFLNPMALVAASIAVLILAIYGLGLFSQPFNSQSAFDQYFEVYRSPVQARSNESLSEKTFDKAIRFYQAKEYSKCLDVLQKIEATQNTTPVYLIQFYRAMAQLAQQPPATDEAILGFEQVRNSLNDYQQQATWYQALAYLHNGNLAAAKVNLRLLVEKKDYKHREAANLLDRL